MFRFLQQSMEDPRMRSLSGSSVTTFLMFIPLLAVPLLAIFGIPEFSPVNASPSGDKHGGLTIADSQPVGGQSDKHSPEDLFAEVEKRSEFQRLNVERRDDPFQKNGATATGQNQPSSVVNARLKGWTVDANRQPPGSTRPQTPIRPRSSGTVTNASHDSERNPFAPNAARSNEKPNTDPDRPKAFAEYIKDRDAKRNAISPAKTGTSLASVPAERVAIPERREAGTPLTWRAAVKRLNEFGINDYRLQPGRTAGEFHFSCVFQPHRGARITHRFEAEDSEPLKAVATVLSQIENWLRRR